MANAPTATTAPASTDTSSQYAAMEAQTEKDNLAMTQASTNISASNNKASFIVGANNNSENKNAQLAGHMAQAKPLA